MRRRLISELNARSYGSRITRLTALEGQINTVTASLFSEGVAKAKAAFGEAFTEGYFRTSYDLQCRSGFARDISGIDEKLIEDVLSYRYDGSDFSSRIWKNKNVLAMNLKNTLTDSLIRGKSAAETASALAKQTDVSFRSAARLVRTETNRFHNEGAMRAYSEAGIEYYEFVVTHDVRTCDECAALDGKRFRLDEKEPGVNFPPLHPNDRCTTVAYDPDWDDGRAKKELEGGYEEWKRRREEENGGGWVDKQRKKEYNKTADKEQYEKYRNRLGDYVPNTFGEFQRLKYGTPEKYEDLSEFYRYMGYNPDSDIHFYRANEAVKAMRSAGIVRTKGTVTKAPRGRVILNINEHAAERLAERGITKEFVQSIVDNADFAVKQRQGTQYAYYNENGFAALGNDGLLGTAGRLDEGGQKMYDEVMKYVRNRK